MRELPSIHLVAAFAVLLFGCAPAPPAQLRAASVRPCPPAPDAPVTMTSVSGASAAAAAVEPPRAPSNHVLWDQMYENGDVYLVAAPEGDVLLVPRFLGATVEGPEVLRVDEAGLVVDHQSKQTTGIVSLTRAPDGTLLGLANDPVERKDFVGYERTRIVRADKQGRPLPSWKLEEKGVTPETLVAMPDGGVLVGAVADTGGGLLIRLDRVGNVAWKHAEPVSPSFAALPSGRFVVLDGAGSSQPVLRLMDTTGTELSRSTLTTKDCVRSGPFTDDRGIIHVVASAGCFSAANAPPPEIAPCEWVRLSGTLAFESAIPIPGCDVITGDDAVMIVGDHALLVLDDQEEAVFAGDVPIPCMMGVNITGFVVDERSVWLGAACQGVRSGTMFNSPFARAYDMSTTYLVRYERASK